MDARVHSTERGQADRALLEHRRTGEVVRLWTMCPWGDGLTAYDLEHVYLFNQLLDAEADGADDLEMARAIFGLDVRKQPDRAFAIVHSHLLRAHWLLENELPYLNW